MLVQLLKKFLKYLNAYQILIFVVLCGLTEDLLLGPELLNPSFPKIYSIS